MVMVPMPPPSGAERGLKQAFTTRTRNITPMKGAVLRRKFTGLNFGDFMVFPCGARLTDYDTTNNKYTTNTDVLQAIL
jgi:hypothetical protein